MTSSLTIPNNSLPPGSKVFYSPSYSTICSIGKAAFYGKIEIEFYPQQTLLEFEAFESWLKTIALDQMTIEDLARLVFDTLKAVLGDILLFVTVHAESTVHAPVSASISNIKRG